MVQPPGARLSIGMALGLTLLSAASARTLLAAAGALGMIRAGVSFEAALEATTADPLVVGMCQLVGLAVAIGVGVLLVHGPSVAYRDALDVRPVSATLAGLALVAGLALQLPIHEAVNLLVEALPTLAPDPDVQVRLARAIAIQDLWDAFAVPVAIVAIPAVFEELFFRGLLQPALSRRHGAPLGLVMSAALFGIAHFEPLAMLYATALGLLLGFVRERTGSVMPCVAMHGAFNAVPVLLAPSIVRIEGFNTFGARASHLPLGLVVGSAILAALALTILTRLTEPREGA